jgi:hypothetical protein
MVYSDYNIGSSTRINNLRTSGDSVQARIFEATGGYPGFLVSNLGFILPAIYFWRKFINYHMLYKLSATLFISFQMKGMINKLSILNMGDPAEVSFLLRDNLNKAKIIKEISDIDGKKVEEENTHHQNEVIRKLNNK